MAEKISWLKKLSGMVWLPESSGSTPKGVAQKIISQSQEADLPLQRDTLAVKAPGEFARSLVARLRESETSDGVAFEIMENGATIHWLVVTPVGCLTLEYTHDSV